MNYSPTAKRILFYGDSFVYGKVSGANERLAADVRFTGQLQKLLGDKFEIVEEGLRGRTLAGENGFFPERDGLQQFGPIIGSHLPFDTLVIFLGTNDCNAHGDANAEKFLSSYEQYIEKLKAWSDFLAVAMPRVILVAPPAVCEEHFDEAMQKVFGPGSTERSKQLPAIIKSCAEQLNVEFSDSSTICTADEGDGIHLNAATNTTLAKALYQALSQD